MCEWHHKNKLFHRGMQTFLQFNTAEREGKADRTARLYNLTFSGLNTFSGISSVDYTLVCKFKRIWESKRNIGEQF